MKKIVFSVIMFGLLFMFGCTSNSNETTNAEKQTNCVDLETGNSMQISEALEIASQSDCVVGGEFVAGDYFCNENTGTWWIDAKNIQEEGCNPACVVDVNTKTAEINWRCTGLLE